MQEAKNQKVKILLRQKQKKKLKGRRETEVVNFRRGVDQCISERDLVLNLRPRYKTRGSSDVEVATPAFEKQGLPHPCPEVSKELEFP